MISEFLAKLAMDSQALNILDSALFGRNKQTIRVLSAKAQSLELNKLELDSSFDPLFLQPPSTRSV